MAIGTFRHVSGSGSVARWSRIYRVQIGELVSVTVGLSMDVTFSITDPAGFNATKLQAMHLAIQTLHSQETPDPVIIRRHAARLTIYSWSYSH